MTSHDGGNGLLRAIGDHDALTYHFTINPDAFVLNLLARQKLRPRSVGHLGFSSFLYRPFVHIVLLIANEIFMS